MTTMVVLAILLDCVRTLVWGAAVGLPLCFFVNRLCALGERTDRDWLEHRERAQTRQLEEATAKRAHERLLIGGGGE